MDKFPLSPYRVLDLTDEKGIFCTKTLAAMGAEVIKVEPPSGDPTRRLGPFFHDEPDPEKSLHWLTYNLNKKSITLDVETATGQDIFKKLVKTADFLVETFQPGYLKKLGLDYAQLSQLNPRLIHTAITPFGSTGPYANFKGSNLVCSALSGYLMLCGDPDRPPVQITTPVAYIEGGLQAAAATLVADWYRQETGEGQYIDVSIQEVLMDQILPVSLVWRAMGVIPHRARAGAVVPGKSGARGPGVFQCKDCFIVASTTIDRGRRPLRDWLGSEGMAGRLFDKEWDPIFVEGGPATAEQKKYIDELFQAFALNHTGDELMWEGQKREVQVVKIHTVRDVVENPHSQHTGYFVDVDHPELGTKIKFPGSPFKSDVISWEYPRRAPRLGEHNEDIYVTELGYSPQELAILKEGGII